MLRRSVIGGKQLLRCRNRSCRYFARGPQTNGMWTTVNAKRFCSATVGAVDNPDRVLIVPRLLFFSVNRAEYGLVIRMSVIPANDLAIWMGLFEAAAQMSLSDAFELHVSWAGFELSGHRVLGRHHERIWTINGIVTHSSGEQANRLVRRGSVTVSLDEIEHVSMHVS